jgi:hypothetical protein
MKATATKMALAPERTELVIKAPNLQIVEFQIRGTAPYVQHRFWKKAQMMATQEAGSTNQSKSRKARAPRDFKADYEQSKHVSTNGWPGIPAPAFRNALISACRVAGFVMTRAKLSVFVLPDGFDADGTPLVKIAKGKAQMHTGYAKNADGSVDIRARAMFPEWQCVVRVRYDGDQFTSTDVANLMERAGMQVGVGEGRPDSPKSAGMGWGTFTAGKDA